MKTTELTLAEALATGRPFKHKSWVGWSTQGNPYNIVYMEYTDVYNKEWEVKEEEKPPMRVWEVGDTCSLYVSSKPSNNDDRDVTEWVAKALAPYIKKELSL